MPELSTVIARGTRASQPAASADNNGGLYCVTDEGNLVERSNGASWDRFALGFRGAMVKKSVDQTAANYTAGAIIAWDAEAFDTDTWHDNVTDNSRLTVPSGVNYVVVSAAIRVESLTSANWVSLIVLKGGLSAFDGAVGQISDVSTTVNTVSLCSGPIAVTAGNYFELQMQIESDTSISVIATRSSFSIRAVG